MKSTEGILGLKLTDKISNISIVIYSCYLPPENSDRGRDAVEYFATIISDLYVHSDCDICIICGDLNARIGNLSDTVPEIDNIPKRVVLDSTKNNHGDSFVDFLKESKCCILNGRVCNDRDNYTFMSHLGKSVVDYIVVNHELLPNCKFFEVMTMNDCVERFDLLELVNDTSKLPDHSLLFTEIDYSLSSNVQTTNKPPENARLRYSRNIPDNFMTSELWKESLQELIADIEHCRNQQSEIDLHYKNLCDTLFKEMDTFLKIDSSKRRSRKKFKYHKPYWNDNLTKLWCNMRDKENQFRLNRHRGKVSNNWYFDFKESQRLFDKELRKAERTYNRGLCIEIENVDVTNPREFWKYISSLGPRKKKDIPLNVYATENKDEIVMNIDKVLSTWKEDFSCLYNKPEHNIEDREYIDMCNTKERLEKQMDEPSYSENVYVNGEITFEEVEGVINKLKMHKAVGLDKIPNEVIRTHDVKLILHKYFNKCFEYCKIPSIWLRALIVPVPKGSGKDPLVPLNYRGISILSCVYKTYSSILNSRIVSYFEELRWFADEQNGFRRNRSCQDHLYVLNSIIRNRKCDNLHTFAAFVDMQKAFDWVDRNLLLLKLLMNNIDGKIYKSIKAMYTDTVSAIQLNQYLTDWFPCTSGVRQGDVLSTTLFNIYINDLVDVLKDLNLGVQVGTEKVALLLYADDIVLLSDSEEGLQNMLDKLYEWCSKWKMSLNIDKTKTVDFRNKKQQCTNHQFTFGNQDIQMTSQYKYLGIVLDEFLDYNVTADILADSAGRALGAVIGKTKQFKDLGFNTFSKLVKSGVIPVLNYGSEIWGFMKFKTCENIQNRAARYFLGLHRFTPIPALRGELGWNDVFIERWISMVRYWNRLLKLEEDRLTSRIFQWDWNLSKDNNNWCSDIKGILNEINLLPNFDNKLTCDIEQVSVSLKEQDKSLWSNNISNKPKLRTYITFKDTLDTEQYVTAFLPKYQRSIFAKFRCGVLPLRIETGRYYGIPVEGRICEFCDKNEIETERHFLCNCTLYNDLRSTLYDAVTIKYPHFCDMETAEQFHILSQSEQLNTSKYVWKAFCRRRALLYK